MDHDYDTILPNFEFSCIGSSTSNVTDNATNVRPGPSSSSSTTITSINDSETVASSSVTKNFTGTAHSGSRWSQREQSILLEEYFARESVLTGSLQGPGQGHKAKVKAWESLVAAVNA